MEEVTPFPDRLIKIAQLAKLRNAEYGANYTIMGPVMHAMYPDGLTVNTEEGWLRLFLQIMRVLKETRYTRNFGRGGHQDSMDDLAVYAQMAAEQDEFANRSRATTVSQQNSSFPVGTTAEEPAPNSAGRGSVMSLISARDDEGVTEATTNVQPPSEHGPPQEPGQMLGEVRERIYQNGWSLNWKWTLNEATGQAEWRVTDERAGPPTPR